MTARGTVKVKPIMWRAGLYLLLILALAELMRLEAVQLDMARRYSEHGYTEWAQSALLLITITLLAVHAWRRADRRALAVCMALTFSVLAIRENDQTFEIWFAHGTWKYVAAVPLLALLAYFWRCRRAVLAQLHVFLDTLPAGILLGGFLTLAFARLFGRTLMWEAVMEEGYLRVVKNAAQEGVEKLALALILVAVAEWVLAAPREPSRVAAPGASGTP